MRKPHVNLFICVLLALVLLLVSMGVSGYSANTFTSDHLLQVLEEEIGKNTNFEGVERFPLVLVEDEVSQELFGNIQDIVRDYGDYSLRSRDHLAVVYFVGDDNLTRGMVKRGMLQTIARIDYHAFANFDNLNHLVVFPRFPMQDEYGNTKMTMVGLQYLHRNTAVKFDWKTVITSLPGKIKSGSDFFNWVSSF